MHIEQIELKLKDMLPEDIFENALKVRDLCYNLARYHDCDPDRLAVAGILHECGKIYNSDELISKAEDFDIPITEMVLTSPIEILHGIIGSNLAKEIFAVEDNEILTSIKHHNYGANEMTIFTKILFVASKIYKFDSKYINEVNEIKEVATKDIDKSVMMTFDLLLKGFIEEGKLINNQIVNSRNKMILSLKPENKI
ncbi:MAG: bis(5'-nucleosyl)-tetraphosphatase (symmetrical) YqeK [Candidatus Sericytochromatia bacterium]